MSNTIKHKHDEQYQSLLDAVERLRADKFPHLGADLVRDLLNLHADGAILDAEFVRAAEQVVEQKLTAE